jgi:hypothetical protein
VEITRAHPRERQRRFPQGFAWNGAGIRTRAAQLMMVVHQSNVFAQPCRSGRGDDTCGAPAQNDEIKDHDFSLCCGPIVSCSETAAGGSCCCRQGLLSTPRME